MRPGLYSSRLARLGHTCLGVDYSPASVAHARAEAEREGLACRYELADLRSADFGGGHDLAMLIYGELNIFRPEHARDLLVRVRQALAPGGALLLEPHTAEAVRQIGEAPPAWYTAETGLFGDSPHLVLTERFWHPAQSAATVRHYVVRAEGGAVERFSQSFQAYTDEEYRALLLGAGFCEVRFSPSLTGVDVPDQPALLVVVAR